MMMRRRLVLDCRVMVWWAVVLFVVIETICVSSELTEGWLESHQELGRDLVESRIIGGTQVSQGEFPFFVEWAGCGASLIAENLVLTAAHCNALPLADDVVLVGAYIDSSSIGGAQFRTITARHVHPKYSNLTMNNDYMVMELDSPVTGITPVKLNSNPNYPADNQVLTVIGFGVTTSGGNQPSVLRKVNVNYVNALVCNTDYGWQLTPSLMLCAGVPNGGKDSCQGDSGGPILDGNNMQVGIVSFGNGCGQKGFPGVYSRLSGGISWINQQICNYSTNPPASCKNPPTGSLPTPPAPTPPNSNSGLITVQISIMYDTYPSETAWILATSSGKSLYYDPAGSGLPNTLSTTSINLSPGPYVLQLLDGFGDGFCCSHGNGYYVIDALINGKKTELSRGYGKFQFETIVKFNVPSTTVRAPVSRTPRPIARPVASPTSSSSCKDSTNTITINSSQRSCSWLSVRPTLLSSQCVNGKPAYVYCKKTCKRC